MSETNTFGIYQCNKCGHLVPIEQEVFCRECKKGEMLYIGKIFIKTITKYHNPKKQLNAGKAHKEGLLELPTNSAKEKEL